MSLTLNEYQNKAGAFAAYKDSSYPMYGLVEEVGEFHGKYAKYLRGDEAYQDEDWLNRALQKEAGDILWMLAAMCAEHGWSLEQVAEANLDKLGSRKERGVIKGDGDDR